MGFELRRDSDGGYRIFPEEKTGCSCSTIIVLFIIVCIVGMCSDRDKPTTNNSKEPVTQNDESVRSETEDNIEESANTTSVPNINWDDYFDTDEVTNEEPSTNDNGDLQQEVIIDDVNHHESDYPRNEIDNESSHDYNNMQHEPQVIDDDVNQYNTNYNQTAKQPATNEVEVKEKPLFSTDDIVSTKQVGNYKVFYLKDGRIVRYDRTTGKNTIIQRGVREKKAEAFFEDEIYLCQ